jgi:hypothetical protein
MRDMRNKTAASVWAQHGDRAVVSSPRRQLLTALGVMTVVVMTVWILVILAGVDLSVEPTKD